MRFAGECRHANLKWAHAIDERPNAAHSGRVGMSDTSLVVPAQIDLIYCQPRYPTPPVFQAVPRTLVELLQASRAFAPHHSLDVTHFLPSHRTLRT